MTEANKDEADKCKRIAQTALAAGDVDKATRFLQKAKRMCPDDSSIDALLAAAASGATSGSGTSAAGGSSGGAGAAPQAPRYRGAQASAGTGSASAGRPAGMRTGKDGGNYTPEQAQMVQRILRTQDYYDILDVPKSAHEDAVKKAYKKLALKLHPDKNKAPGAEEAFKKLSKAVQCLTDEEKKKVYDTYGDEERIPQHHRQHYQQDFMSPEDLFSAFFGGSGFHTTFHTNHGHRGGDGEGGAQQRAHLVQMLPIILLIVLTLASNLASSRGGNRFSFQESQGYRNEKRTVNLDVPYWVTDEFDNHYSEGTHAMAEFEKQVEIYYVRNLASECDQQEKLMHKKVVMAKRRGDKDELIAARNHPKPKCKEMDRVKRKFPSIYRQAMYMGAY